MKNFFNRLGILGWLLIATTALAAGIGGSIFEIGTDTFTGDVEIRMRDGRIKWNDTDNVLQFSNDAGVQFKDIGAGGGAGGTGGINLLLNPSFEDIGTPIADWSNTGGTFTQNPHGNNREGNEQFARFVATGAAEYFESALVTIADDIGPGCMADFKYKQGDNAFEYKVLDQVNTVISSGTISDLTSLTKAPTVTFPCNPGDQFKLRIESTGAGTIDADEAYLGSNKGFVDGQNANHNEAYTPTFQGFGTVSNIDFIWKQSGADSIIIQGFFQAGTVAVSEGQISLPSGLTISGNTGIVSVGEYITGAVGTANTGGAILATNGDTFLNIGASTVFSGTVTSTGLTPANGNVVPSNATMSFTVTVPVSGLPNNTQEAFTPEQFEFFSEFNIGGANVVTNTIVATGTEITSATWDLVNRKGTAAQIACINGTASTGLTCSGVNESLGFSMNFPRNGKFEICATIPTEGVSTRITFKIGKVDNTSGAILDLGNNISFIGGATVTLNDTPTNCSVFDINSVGKHTFKILHEQATTGNFTWLADRSTSYSEREFYFTVKPLFHNGSRQITDNMVDTGTTRKTIESCAIDMTSGTPLVGDKNGNCHWISGLTDDAVGQSTVSANVGFDILKADCSCQAVQAVLTNSIGCGMYAETSSSFQISLFRTDTSATLDLKANVFCTFNK